MRQLGERCALRRGLRFYLFDVPEALQRVDLDVRFWTLSFRSMGPKPYIAHRNVLFVGSPPESTPVRLKPIRTLWECVQWGGFVLYVLNFLSFRYPQFSKLCTPTSAVDPMRLRSHPLIPEVCPAQAQRHCLPCHGPGLQCRELGEGALGLMACSWDCSCWQQVCFLTLNLTILNPTPPPPPPTWFCSFCDLFASCQGVDTFRLMQSEGRTGEHPDSSWRLMGSYKQGDKCPKWSYMCNYHTSNPTYTCS